jgi:hypothetical protein
MPLDIYKMTSVSNYLEDTEKKMVKEMAELFNKMREQRDIMSLEGIKDMYSCKPIEGILYEPCVRIPLTLSNLGIRYNSAYVRLPKDEVVIHIFRHHYSINNAPSFAEWYYCFALTNYGRLINTMPVMLSRGPFDSSLNDNSPTTLTIIEKLEILPYKMPSWYYSVFKKIHDKLHLFLGGGYTTSNSHSTCPSQEILNKIASDTTISLQELNKEFYLFAGKWQPHMTEHATLDIDKMRETIIENTDSIQDLTEKNRELEEQNKSLQEELKELKEQKANLEKEKTKLLSLEKYKEAVIDFMDNHYTGKEPYDHDSTPDIDVIWYFSEWHLNKAFMDECVYHDVIKSKEELNEYRIYKKVKGEMVSSGMDNSNVARNVRSIKKGVNKLHNNTDT